MLGRDCRWWGVLGLTVACAAERPSSPAVHPKARPTQPPDHTPVHATPSGAREHWRSTVHGPAVDWRLPQTGGTVQLPVDAEVSVRADGRWARLVVDSGQAYTFGPLLAWDTAGVPVAAKFREASGTLIVDVPPGMAPGPVMVDPVLRTAPFSAAFAAESVAGVGDLDGDGFDEIAAGAAAGTTTGTGQVRVWMGAAAGPDPSAPVDPTPGGAGWRYGRAVAGDGDLDGDGYADLVVGGDHRAWVHYGAATGVGGRTTRLDDPSGGTTDFGYAVAVAPDLDGDALHDLVVGDPGYDASRGALFVYAGQAGTAVDTTPSQSLEGSAAGEWFGVAVAGTGDVNGDGWGDLVVGAHAWNGITGRAYIFHGSTTGLSSAPDTTLAGVDPLDNFGRAVDGAGDVDSDGYADVVVGAFNGGLGFGQAAVFHGTTDGLQTTATTVVLGPSYGAKFGQSVAALGDVDGDGFDDVAMGGHGTTPRAGVHHGSTAGSASTAVPALGGGVTFGKLLDGAGDVDGDGFPELLVADPGAGTVDLFYGGPDLDGDGWISPEDCDDADTAVRGGTELFTDGDGDGFGDPLTGEVVCVWQPHHVRVAGDCDDTDPAIHPDALEGVGDRRDSDCDGLELCYVDADADGVLEDLAATTELVVATDGLDCVAAGWRDADGPWGDCNDGDPAVYPGAPEACDRRDGDCDGRVDSPVPATAPAWVSDVDGDGFGAGPETQACEAPSGSVAVGGEVDCNDMDAAIYPGASEQPGDGIDSDCDGSDPPEDATVPDSGTPQAETSAEQGARAGKSTCGVGGAPSGVAWLGLVGVWLRRARRAAPRRRWCSQAATPR